MVDKNLLVDADVVRRKLIITNIKKHIEAYSLQEPCALSALQYV